MCCSSWYIAVSFIATLCVSIHSQSVQVASTLSMSETFHLCRGTSYIWSQKCHSIFVYVTRFKNGILFLMWRLPFFWTPSLLASSPWHCSRLPSRIWSCCWRHHTLWLQDREIKWLLTRKLSPYWLAFIIPKGQKSPTILLEQKGLPTYSTRKDCPHLGM